MKDIHSPDDQKYFKFFVGLLAPKQGEVLLDIGCGHGNEIKIICGSSRVKKVYGLDVSRKALSTASNNLRGEIRNKRVELMEFDASHPLPFKSASINAVFSLDLLECLNESKRLMLLSEIYRVLKPAGRMIMGHTDWDTQAWNSSYKDLERNLVHAYCDTKQKWMAHAEGWMGRKLWGWVNQKKFFRKISLETCVLTNTEYKPNLVGYKLSRSLEVGLGHKKYRVSKKDLSRFLADLKVQARRKSYFYSLNRHLLVAQK